MRRCDERHIVGLALDNALGDGLYCQIGCGAVAVTATAQEGNLGEGVGNVMGQSMCSDCAHRGAYRNIA